MVLRKWDDENSDFATSVEVGGDEVVDRLSECSCRMKIAQQSAEAATAECVFSDAALFLVTVECWFCRHCKRVREERVSEVLFSALSLSPSRSPPTSC